ncbi:hypothetical protein Tco_1043476 [Tanacetum coccineum]|uniref:Uncharacterized protein n=1 Tax=Tanacetum coccineum TaxID=301880 RepID=A0ABQ5GND5_9ASTR
METRSLEAAPQAPPSPDYVPGPEHPPSPDYVPVPEYPKFLAPSDDDIPIEYQPLPVDALLITLSPGYIADSDPKEDPKDDPEEDPADYLANGGDEEEFSKDDVDDDDEEEASEEEDDNEEEEEHLAPADSSTIPIDDLIPSARETEPFETDESAPTPPRLRRARIYILLPPLPLLPLPLHAPSSHLLLPATDCMEDVSEADVPPQKRLYLTAPTPRFEVRESSVARQPGLDVTHATDYGFDDTMDATPGCPMSREVGYGITDVWDDMVGDMEETALTN